MPAQPAPGWYPDPGGSGGERYWDGGAWAQEVRSAPAPGSGAGPAAPPPAATGGGGNQKSGLGKAQQFALAGAAILAVAVFLPWASAGGESANGFESELPWFLTGFGESDLDTDDPGTFIAHGLGFLALAAGAVFVTFTRPAAERKRFLPVIGGLAVLLAIVDFFSFRSVYESFEGVSIGIGLYLAVMGGTAIAVSNLRFADDPTSAAPVNPTSTSAPAPGPPPGGTPGGHAPQADSRTVPPEPQPNPGPVNDPHPPGSRPQPPSQPGSAGNWWE
ncbi:MAG: DUF2510 domain-containing protein [Actinomycetia bacterium]|nr:DUF2510 domain-containing protein [Actinomycetes bacterium]